MDRKSRIRQIIVYALYVFLLASFQVSFPQFISIRGQVADIMFVLVVLVAYFYGFLDGAIVALSVGLLRDYFAGPSFIGIDGKATQTVGIGVLVMFLAAAVSSSFFTKRMHRNWPFAFLSVISCTLIYKVVGYLVVAFWTVAITGKSFNFTVAKILLDSILPQLLLNTIATIPLILMLRFIGPYRKGINPNLTNEDNGGNSWLTI